jgi:hypothetical protein
MLGPAADVALDGDFQIVDGRRAVEGRFERGERCRERGARAVICRVACRYGGALGAFKIALRARPLSGGRVI